MLKQPDAADFIHAMTKESDDYESRDHWDVLPRWENPPDVKAILDIWAFKWKRFPDGRINKHKARLCAHGGMQQYGVTYCCCCSRSPGRMPCANDEVVEFQPWTVDNSALDSGCPARILSARRDEVNPHFNDKGKMNGYIGNDNRERNERRIDTGGTHSHMSLQLPPLWQVGTCYFQNSPEKPLPRSVKIRYCAWV